MPDLNRVFEILQPLRKAFTDAGHDLRAVGGAVRDFYLGVEPHDIDFCTDANPDEQIAIYKANGFVYYETGLTHGTLTVRFNNENYEITSLRTETDHDGRHATVSYTRDWLLDAGRRDLRFNSMSLTFEGELIDPFNGLDDLKNNIVRFVGNPDERMREDYLRILRWLRFHGRFAQSTPLDLVTMEAAIRNAEGLKGISRERVWMEMAKIITGNDAGYLIQCMYDMNIAEYIGLPDRQGTLINQITNNPVTRIVSILFNEDIEFLTQEWKWSAEERDLALFLRNNRGHQSQTLSQATYQRLVAHDGYSKEWVIELAHLHLDEEAVVAIQGWDVPTFPVKGVDLIQAGIKPGPQMGEKLREMKKAWAISSYTATKETLMKIV